MSEPRDPTVTESEGGPELAQPIAVPATDLRTFMIADIRGYTTYTEEHGDEAGAALVLRFTELVSEVVSARDGLVLELRGDEALVVFVSARKALRAAVDLQDRFAAENLPRGIGIGLDAGEAIPFGDGYRGTALNLAARLCAKAAPGETLASEAVIHLAAKMDGIAYVDARDLRLKGYSDSVRAVVVVPSDRAKGRRIVTDRRSASRKRSWFAGVVALLIVALIAGTSGYFLVNRSSQPTGQPTTQPTDTNSAAALATTTAGTSAPSGSPDPFAYESLPLLAFYDQASGELKATTQVVSPKNLSFFAGDSFWILAGNQFLRVDPVDHRVTQEVNVPLDEPNGFSWDDDYIWITDLAGARVFRVDQRSGTQTSFPFNKDAQDDAPATDVAIGAGSVWLARPDVGEIVRMDRLSGKVQSRLPINAWGMSYGADALWYWREGSIGRIDPNTEQEPFPAVQLTTESGLGNIYFAGGDAWTSSADIGSVYRVTGTGTTTTYALEPGVGEMAPTADTMWVTNANSGALTGIDIVTGQQDRTIDTGHATLAAVAGADQLMVAVGPTPDETIAHLPGSVLTIATSGFPWWDPAPDPPLAGDWQVQQGLYITCANLVTYPDKPGPDGLTLVPEVADMPTVSADGLTYTFKIRPGFMFSPPSNEPVTAETFRYTLQRAVSPVFGDGDPGPSNFGDIAGVSEYRAGTADHVSGLVANPNGDQLTITLVTPEPDFLMRLATSYACPVPTTGTPALRSGLKPPIPVAGDGPYYISQMIRKRLVVFAKNPNYHGSRPQPFDEIAVRLQVASTTAIGMVRSREVDAVMFDGGDSLSGSQSGLDNDWGPSSLEASAGNQRWFGGPRHNVDTLVLNQTRAPFNDPSVRKAVALALDRFALSRIWVDQPTSDMLPPSVQGSDAAAQAAQPDLQAALALMNGTTLKATMMGFPIEWGCNACHAFEVEVTKELQAIGIDVTVRHPDNGNGDYPGDGVFDPGSDIDLLAWGTGADTPDPASFLGGFDAISWLGKSSLDQLTTLGQATGQQRIDGSVAWSQQAVTDDNVVVPIGYGVYPFYISDRIGCGFVQPAIGAVDLLSLCVKDGSNAPPAPSPSP